MYENGIKTQRNLVLKIIDKMAPDPFIIKLIKYANYYQHLVEPVIRSS